MLDTTKNRDQPGYRANEGYSSDAELWRITVCNGDSVTPVSDNSSIRGKKAV
jgi:hypothetical protein